LSCTYLSRHEGWRLAHTRSGLGFALAFAAALVLYLGLHLYRLRRQRGLGAGKQELVEEPGEWREEELQQGAYDMRPLERPRDGGSPRLRAL
tara:strand:- start:268 stop:543 length:276 start_codon:yes stop_codon:yes gene_type:complete